MIGRNTFSKLIIFILFIHTILSILASSMLVRKDDVVSCLSPLDSNSISQVYDNNSTLKNIHYVYPSSYPDYDKPVCKVETEDKVVSFSFDDGYNYDNILDIVNIFKENGDLKTTFFFCGHAIDSDEKDRQKNSLERDNSVKLVFDNGHEIGNHSNSHSNFKKLNRESSENEIINCNEKIKSITGTYPTVFRFPYGAYNKASLSVVKYLNMFPVHWSIDTLDWKKSSSFESIYDRIINNLHNGAIILMHTNGKHTAQALRKAIPKILELGYKIVSVSDLITKNY